MTYWKLGALRLFNLIHFLGVAMILSVSSCSLDKKIYSSGYHIDWKKTDIDPIRHAVSTDINNSTDSLDKENRTTIQEDNQFVIHDEPAFVASIDKSIEMYRAEKVKSLSQIKKEVQEVSPIIKSENKIKDNVPEPKINRFAIASIVAEFISILGYFIYFPFVLFCTFTFAVVLALIALHQINKHPEKYLRKKLTIAALLLGLFVLVGFTISLLSFLSVGR